MQCSCSKKKHCDIFSAGKKKKNVIKKRIYKQLAMLVVDFADTIICISVFIDFHVSSRKNSERKRKTFDSATTTKKYDESK